jgi:UDPglucose 6-dehydrogenase
MTADLRLAVFGLGRVGLPFAVFLSRWFPVIGVDLSHVVDQLRSGRVSFSEPWLTIDFRRQMSRGRLEITDNLTRPVDCAFLCLPSDLGGVLDASRVVSVAHEVRRKLSSVEIVVRSTVPVGTCRRLKAEVGGTLLHFPEFLREGSAMQDLKQPRYVVFGASSPADARFTKVVLSRIGYPPPNVLSFEEAELFKLIVNAFNALRVSFVNELQMAMAEQNTDVDLGSLTELLVSSGDTMRSYLRPGLPYGGPCLPLAVGYLASLRKNRRLTRASLFETVADVRSETIEWLSREVLATLRRLNGKSVGIIGGSFKPCTGDLRYAPAVDLARLLSSSAVSVRLFDPDISPSSAMDSEPVWVGSLDQVLDADVVIIADERFAPLVLERCRLALLPSGRWIHGKSS